MENNFIVSARKYRPATFETVVGQGHITSTLKNAIARGQLAHAYLFCGPRGVGKTTCARIFAKTINCLNPTAEGDACGECESCKSFNEGRSFTIHELDAASNNSVENIRDLTDQVRVPPQVGRYSVYIIDEVHMLSQAAFNAFLKTLEEPPQHAIFILATTEKHKIIPTILSRCQIYDFNRIRIEDTVSYLKGIATKEGVEFDDESLHLIARKADGGMRDALSMFDKAVSFCQGKLAYKEVAATLDVLDYDTYFGITNNILTGDYRTALMTFDEVLKKGFSGQTFMAGLASHFRDLLMCKDPQTLPLLETTGSVLERYKEQSKACDAGLLFGGISLLSALDGGFRTATNQRLHVELGLMKLCGLGQKKNSDDEVAPTLPPLNKGAEGRAATAPQAATTQAAATQPATQPAAQQPSVQQPSVAAPKVEVAQQHRASEPTAVATPRQAVEQTTTTPTPSATKPLFGGSINAILAGKKGTQQENGEESEAEQEFYDAESQAKVEAKRGEFLAELRKHNPRLSNALEKMEIDGYTIRTTVITEMVREELLRNRGELNALLREVCGIEGSMVFEVTVTKSKESVKPIRVEDRLRFMLDQNPEVANLIQALDSNVD